MHPTRRARTRAPPLLDTVKLVRIEATAKVLATVLPHLAVKIKGKSPFMFLGWHGKNNFLALESFMYCEVKLQR